MKPRITIRDFQQGDMERLLEFREETGRMSFPGLRMDREKVMRSLLRHAEKYPGTIKIALSGGVLVGFIRFRPRSGDFGRYGHINIIYVEEGFRHMGVGEMLLHEAERWLKKKGITQISAEITSTNAASLDFFRGQGYAQKRVVVEKEFGKTA